MREFYKAIMFFAIVSFNSTLLHSQQIELNGTVNHQINPAIYFDGRITVNNPDTVTSPCLNPNSFWGFNNNAFNVLTEFVLNGTTISSTGNTLNIPRPNVAISNNLNGGSVSPTFYCGDLSLANYWDGGNTWQPTSTTTLSLSHCGGNGNFLYFLNNGLTIPTTVTSYDGSTFSLLFSTNKVWTVADVASDALGNVYLAVGSTPQVSDSLYVISPTGVIIKQYSFPVNTSYSYGSFLLNGVYYIGLLSGNPVYSKGLLPVTLTGTTAIPGNVIPFPTGSDVFLDLASCNPGFPLGLNSIDDEPNFVLSPNPAHENLTITTTTLFNSTYSVYSVEGKKVISTTNIASSPITIKVSSLKKGIYFVEIKNQKGILRKKFTKM